jgi:SAM-dependent methyltransferase
MAEAARLYRLSLALGARYLARHGYLREAVVRVVVPMDPSRYMELPWTWRELAPPPGSAVLDLASPKLLAVALARSGVHVTSVDALPREIEAWRRLAESEPNLTFEIADGRALPHADASFDHAYSVSVLEHVDGDAQALRELARVLRPGGRLVITLPHAPEAWDEYRTRATYAEEAGESGRYLFQRWYDAEHVDRLLAEVPDLEPIRREVVRLQPNLNTLYTRTFPWLVPLGPFCGVFAREIRDPEGDVVRVLLRKKLSQPASSA